MSHDEAVPRFLQSTLRLFLSVDIAGSTQFKQALNSRAGGASKAAKDEESKFRGEPWISPILEFYELVSDLYSKHWAELSKRARSQRWLEDLGDEPTVWKAIGDEIIFVKELTDHRQAYVCVTAWLEMVKEYRQTLQSHSGSLDLKCAGWIAGFPINNAEVALPSSQRGAAKREDIGDYIIENFLRLHDGAANYVRDFIGPSIDTGFRVATQSSPRKFVVAADLAFILAHTSVSLSAVDPPFTPFKFFYEGRQSLKGVTNGIPYPIFWIEATDQDGFGAIEDSLDGRSEVHAADVKRFCEHYLHKNRDTHVMPPFIVGDKDPTFASVPVSHQERLEKLVNYWRAGKATLDGEQAAAVAEPDGDVPPAQPAVDFFRALDLLRAAIKANLPPPEPPVDEGQDPPSDN